MIGTNRLVITLNSVIDKFGLGGHLHVEIVPNIKIFN